MQPIAVSTGDPAGIGPEIIARAWQDRNRAGLSPFFLCAPEALLPALPCPTAVVADTEQVSAVFTGALPVLPLADVPSGPLLPGRPNDRTARIALASLDAAIAHAVEGRASALVTGPVAKSALYAIGFRHEGQTEYVGEKSGAGARAGVMMLAGPSVRVVPVTIHVPLKDVPRLLTRELIVHTARTVDTALRRDFGIATPRLAMAGLNPHAGEQGKIGSEEIEIIAPALEALKTEGIVIEGPLPADSLFHERGRENYDVVLCPTHDQALIPIKALHFDEAANMTLGLPVIRTSPDHGTAFALAGKGEAHPGSMIAAIRMAGEAARMRRRNES